MGRTTPPAPSLAGDAASAALNSFAVAEVRANEIKFLSSAIVSIL